MNKNSFVKYFRTTAFLAALFIASGSQATTYHQLDVEEVIVYGHAWTGFSGFQLGSIYNFVGTNAGAGITMTGRVYQAPANSNDNDSNDEDKPKCTKSMAEGGFTSIVVEPVKLSMGHILLSPSVAAAAWPLIAEKAQKRYGGKVAGDTPGGVYVIAKYEFKGAVATWSGPIQMPANQSVYESILDHVNVSPKTSKLKEYDCKASN